VKSKHSRWALVAVMLILPSSGVQPGFVLAQEQHGSSRQVTKRVTPDYPELAKRMNLTGKVRVEVVIAADGRVKQTRPVGGHPVLLQSVERAVRDWRFAPAGEQTTQVVEMEFAGVEVH